MSGASAIPAPRPPAPFQFPIRGSFQWKRVDKGQDFQTTPGTPLVAVVSGTLSAGNDPGGFGPRYPILHGDDGHSYYYGHVDLPTILQGKHVTAGTVITRTGAPRGNATSPGWFEFGDASLLGRGGETGGGPISRILHQSAPKSAGGGGINVPKALGAAAIGASPGGAVVGLGSGFAAQAAGAVSGTVGDVLSAPQKAAEATAGAIVNLLADSFGAHAARIMLYIVLIGGGAALAVAGLARAAGVTPGDAVKAAVAVPK
jgi:hypothetical protein